jgi:hypothetical protein
VITVQANGVTPKQLSSILMTFHDTSVRKCYAVAPA